MKKQFAFVIIVLVYFISAINLCASETDKEKTFNVSKGENLEITLTNGNITINTWEKDQVYIKAKNVDEDDLQNLHMDRQGSKVIVDFNGTDSDDFTLEVAVPTQFNLDLLSGGGNVSITANITGKVDITTGGGNIKTQDVYGKLLISTGGGNIDIQNINADAEVTTGGGNITIGDTKDKIDVSTGGGNIVIGNIGGNADVSTAGGIISVGKVSGNAELSTAGGNINLEGATGNVEVNTAGGNINVKNISGTIAGNTAGGNIYADLILPLSGYSEFSTAGGDINLIIPSDAKLNIMANVNVGKNLRESDADKFIKSDFDPVTVDFNKSNLIKRFVINGGGATIDLNTAAGKIKINKK